MIFEWKKRRGIDWSRSTKFLDAERYWLGCLGICRQGSGTVLQVKVFETLTCLLSSPVLPDTWAPVPAQELYKQVYLVEQGPGAGQR